MNQRIALVCSPILTCLSLAGCGQSSQAPAAEAPAAEAPAKAAAVAEAQQAPTAEGAEAPAAQSAELGKPAPDFTLTDTAGKSYKLSELRGKTVVLEWFNPDCPFVRHAHGQGVLKDMARQVAGEDLVWLSINSGGPGKQGHGLERNKEALGQYGMQNPVLLDESGSVGRAYGADKTPHMYVIDQAGVLVYRGGIDNAPMGEVDPERPTPEGAKAGERVNYVQLALEDLNLKRPVRLADTPAYGCGVKYAG